MGFAVDLLSRAAQRLGYRLAPAEAPDSALYVLHQYKDASGEFDYARYRRVQTEGNRRKIETVWVQRENIVFLAALIRERMPVPTFGLCHGTRRGLEQQWFGEELGCPVLGTEISDTATQFPDTIQWDFHEAKDEWLGAADFVYSNSFDHAHDPEKALGSWMRCLKPGGLCILEHSTRHGPEGASELDPFGADLFVLPYLVLRWGRGRYAVRELLDAPRSKSRNFTTRFLVLMNG